MDSIELPTVLVEHDWTGRCCEFNWGFSLSFDFCINKWNIILVEYIPKNENHGSNISWYAINKKKLFTLLWIYIKTYFEVLADPLAERSDWQIHFVAPSFPFIL